MTDRELMQQALEALEKIAAYRPLTFAECSDAEAVMGIAENAIPALRKRLAQQEQCQYPDCKCATENPCLKGLAQPEQEPVAWRWKERINGDFDSWVISASEPPPYAIEQQPLYTTPPQRKPEQEPVAHTLNCVCGAVWDVSPDGVEEMVHAPNPPQRKPLTDEQIDAEWRELDGEASPLFKRVIRKFARAIEAKLKEKNT